MMRLLLALLLTLGTFSLCFSQSNPTKSNPSQTASFKKLETLVKENPEAYQKEFGALEKQWTVEGNREALLDLYFLHLDQLLTRGNYDSALLLLHKARRLYPNASNQALVPVYLSFASVLYYKANLDSMGYYQNLATKKLDINSPHYGQYLLNEGLKSQLNADFRKAIDRIIEAISFYEKKNDLKSLAKAYNNLASNYNKIGEIDVQIKYLLKAIDLNKTLGNTYLLIMNYNNLGLAFKEKGDFDQAIAYYDLAFEGIGKIYNPMMLAQNIMNRGNIFKRKGDLKKAEMLFLESLALCEANQMDYGAMLCMLNLGELYISLQRYETANTYLSKANDLSKLLQARREQALSYERLAWLARDMGDYRSAYDWQTKFQALNDSLINESVKKEANALREKFEVEKKEKEIITLSKTKLYQQYVITLMLVPLLILILLMQWLRHKHRMTKTKLMATEEMYKLKQDVLILREWDLLQQTMEKVVLQQHIDELFIKIEQNNDVRMGYKVKSIKEKKNPWDGMIVKFKLLNPQFIEKLSKDYPKLTRSEVELCSFIKMNLSTKEIAQILNISVDSVFTKKYRVSKKLNLGKDIDLSSHIHSF